MPKKFGTNTKQEEARARKAETKRVAQEKVAKDKEDAKWFNTKGNIVCC